MKTKMSFFLLILVSFSTAAVAQKPDAAVNEFYKFHFAHENIFDEKEVKLRRVFFSSRLAKLFDRELVRQKNYLKKYPDNKPYFEGLPFAPIEFCPKDYRVNNAATDGGKSIVTVDFVYGKSSCEANDGTKISYKISLVQIGGKWLINDFIYDDGETLTKAFAKASQIK